MEREAWDYSALAIASNDLERSLNAAFATNDLQRICRAVDVGILQAASIIEIAHAAEVDRTTLYRAFRRGEGPALDTMIKVLCVLGFRVIVEVGSDAGERVKRSPARRRSNAEKRRYSATKATARRLTRAFQSGQTDSLRQVFGETLRSQDNVAEFATKTIVSRETLYRIFTGPKTPRFGTVLSFLNALELRVAVQRLVDSD